MPQDTNTMQKRKRELLVSPKGTAVWPKLNAPDTQFKEEGEYGVKLAVDPSKDPKVQPWLDDLQARFDTYLDEVKAEVGPVKAKKIKPNDPFTPELDEAGEETGRILVKFGMAASFKDKKTGQPKTMKPALFDARGNPLVNPPQIGNGSVLRVSYTVGSYNTPQATGIKLYLNAVQVIELVEFGGGGDAKGYGFDVEEDGFQTEASKNGFDAADDGEEQSEDF